VIVSALTEADASYWRQVVDFAKRRSLVPEGHRIEKQQPYNRAGFDTDNDGVGFPPRTRRRSGRPVSALRPSLQSRLSAHLVDSPKLAG
jgi:hypothetical protein